MALSVDQLSQIKEWQAAVEAFRAVFPVAQKQQEIEVLREKTLLPDFWQDTETAGRINQQLSSLEKELSDVALLETMSKDIQSLVELLQEGDDDLLQKELKKTLREGSRLLDVLELKTFLSGRYDANEAILSIHSGQGGTEAMDWADMLRRMYVRYFERQGWKAELLDESRGEEAGIKSVTYVVHAAYAYGYLRREQGTHRLVRQSPFNADDLRQTSFAGVEVLPVIPEEDADFVVPPEELDWAFSRAGGKGGQNVNKVNTAVLLRHIPTGITVSCRQERSQEQNRKVALQLLRAELARRAEVQRAEELAAVKGVHTMASWGTQIRNYVLHPYKLVKDTRTQVERTDPDVVLDGDLDDFIIAAVRSNV